MAIRQARQHLQAQSYPRLHMSLITALTGAFGLLASFALLQSGVQAMAWRYPLAVLLAWGMFLFLIGLWLRSGTRDWPDVGCARSAAPWWPRPDGPARAQRWWR